MEFLQKVINMIPDAGAAIVVALGGILDLAMRLFRTEKPRDLVRLLAGAVRLVATGLEKLAKLLDAILPQRVKNDSNNS